MEGKSLNHVYMLTDKGMIHVTCEDVKRIHPIGHISAGADRDFLQCRLCGKPVEFRNGEQRFYFCHPIEQQVISSIIFDIIQIINQAERKDRMKYKKIRTIYKDKMKERTMLLPSILSDYSPPEISNEAVEDKKMQEYSTDKNIIIKRLILSRAVWAEFKKRDITKKTWEH